MDTFLSIQDVIPIGSAGFWRQSLCKYCLAWCLFPSRLAPSAGPYGPQTACWLQHGRQPHGGHWPACGPRLWRAGSRRWMPRSCLLVSIRCGTRERGGMLVRICGAICACSSAVLTVWDLRCCMVAHDQAVVTGCSCGCRTCGCLD